MSARMHTRWPSESRGIADASPRERANTLELRLAAGLLVVAIFLLDTLTTLEGAVAVLYVVPVLLVARTYRRSDIVGAAVGGVVLTIFAYAVGHGLEHVGSQTVRAFVSLSAIGIAALLALQNQTAMRTLSAQAMLLDISHDMIFVRDPGGTITFWNRTAEKIYGWDSVDALGRKADELLQTRYPDHRDAIEAELLNTGIWEGTLIQTTRSGLELMLDSRWVLQRDHLGRPAGVLETHTDVTERKAAHAALVRSERRYRRMFDATRIGVIEQDWTAIRAELEALALRDVNALEAHLAEHPEFLRRARGLIRIEDVNPAFAALHSSDASSRLPQSVHDVLSESDRTFAGALLAFARGDSFYEGETEIVRTNGNRVPVLFAITFPSREHDDASVLVFVIDITERRRAQDALLLAQTELAHATRVATLGELTASIAHEINQPLMAVVTDGQAGMRWLKREPPDLYETEAAIGRIVVEGRRAADIVHRIRAFLGKAPVPQHDLDLAGVVADAARLVGHELARGQVELHLEVDPHLPAIRGDRVQLQQVLVNLMVNASQAMNAQTGRRLLTVRAVRVDDRQVEIAVRDTGPGIAPEHREYLFDAFFTTKPQGMGMGLAICRTIVDAHGGQLAVDGASGPGATFTLTLPVPASDPLP